MIKSGGFPGSGGVTSRAVGAIFAAVSVVLGMAGKTGGRSAFENTANMTASTGCG